MTTTESHVGRPITRCRLTRCTPLVALLGTLVAALPGWAPPVSAQAQLGSFPGFVDPNRVTAAAAPSKVSYLGAGNGASAWLTRYTDDSWGGSEFGFVTEQTDLPAFRNTLKYPSSNGFRVAQETDNGTIVDMVTGIVGGPPAGVDPIQAGKVVAAVVIRYAFNGQTQYSVWVIGPQDQGFPHATRVYGALPGTSQPKIALLNQGGALRTNSRFLIVSNPRPNNSTLELLSYEIRLPSPTSTEPQIPTSTYRATYTTSNGDPILALAHRPYHEIIDGSFPAEQLPNDSPAPRTIRAAYTDNLFMTVQGFRRNDGTYRPLIVAHKIDANGNFIEATRLNNVNGNDDFEGPPELRFPIGLQTSDRFELRYDIFASGNSTTGVRLGYFIGYRDGNDQSATAYYAPSKGPALQFRWSHNRITSCGRDGGFDFRAFQEQGKFGPENVIWNLICVNPERNSGTDANARMVVQAARGTGVNATNNNNVTLTIDQIAGPVQVDGPNGPVTQSGSRVLGARFRDPQVFLEFPCLELLKVFGPKEGTDNCSAKYEMNEDKTYIVREPGNASFTVLAGEDGSSDAVRATSFRASIHHGTVAGNRIDYRWPSEAAPDAGSTVGSLRSPSIGTIRTLARQPARPLQVLVDLDPQFEPCRQPMRPGACNPTTIQRDPALIAILSAPPTVLNSGQGTGSYPSTYGGRQGTTTGEAKSLTGTVGVYAGGTFDYEVGATTFTVGYESSIGQTDGTSTTTTASNGVIIGDPTATEDYVVFQSHSDLLFTGRVIYNSEGFDFGQPYNILVPLPSTAPSALKWSTAQSTFPDHFGPGRAGIRTLKSGVDTVLNGHVPGYPDSYPAFGADGTNLYSRTAADGRCLGQIKVPRGTSSPVPFRDATGVLVTRRSSPALNKFTTKNAPSPNNGILVSSPVQVQFDNDQVINFAGFSLDQESSKTYNEEHSVRLEVEQRIGPETAAAVVGGSVGVLQGIERSFGTAFGSDFEGQVQNFSFPRVMFPNESFRWRMYLCTVDIGTPAGVGPYPVLHAGFTVDNYLGRGGFEPLGPMRPITPIGASSETAPTASRNPMLLFDHPEGTMLNYRVNVQGISAQDKRSRTLTFCRTDRACDPAARPKRLQVAPASRAQPLLANTVYAWRVEGTDFLGNVVQFPDGNAWQYFRTGATVTDSPTVPATTPLLTLTRVERSPRLIGPIRFTARLRDARGVPLPGKRVEFYKRFNQPGVFLFCSGTTNANGVASCAAASTPAANTAAIAIGPFTASYRFDPADPTVGPAQADGNFTIQ